MTTNSYDYLLNLDEMETTKETNLCGNHLKLSHKYILWSHDIFNKDWTLSSYSNLLTISDVSQFWKLFNNFDKMGIKYNHFFLMKEGINPTWEDIANRNGGICSFRVELNKSIEVWEELNIRMMCHTLNDNDDDINGISICPKNNWAIIKIWNRDKNNDLSKTINHDILDKFSNLSIKYKENAPEF